MQIVWDRQAWDLSTCKRREFPTETKEKMMYIWDCTCIDCGHEFEVVDSYAPLECKECGSNQIRALYLGRAYD